MVRAPLSHYSIAPAQKIRIEDTVVKTNPVSLCDYLKKSIQQENQVVFLFDTQAYQLSVFTRGFF